MFKKEHIQPLQLLRSVRDFIINEVSARNPLETGGILIGKLPLEDLMITRALGPGPKAQHDSSGFKRDGQYSQDALNEIFIATQGQEDYVGEWHSHPMPCEASGRDIQSIEWISRDTRYRCESPVLIISIPSSRDGGWKLLGYRWSAKSLHRCELSIIESEQKIGL